MGAKAAAARKGALVPASPKGKAKKKSNIEGNDEDATTVKPLADKITDNTVDNTTNNTVDNTSNNNNDGSNNDSDEDAQEEQEQELDSSSGREPNTPKINFSDQSKARRSLRHIAHLCHALLMPMHMISNGSQQVNSIDTFGLNNSPTKSISNNTNQRANRTWSELALTQSNFPTAHVLRDPSALSLLNTCSSQVFKIETAAKDRPRAKFLNTTMILNGICVHLGLSDNA
eukprot:1687889-Pleurochrysis_carterae.AAC.1